jgi:uncharacterized protein YbjT (DUF2867 family)
MQKKTAIVIGATGLVGGILVRKLIKNQDFEKIIIFHRKETSIKHPKVVEYVVDFNYPKQWQSKIVGDVLFSALGTTISKAKTKENQYRVDFTYQYQVAQMAVKNGIKNYVLVSSSGANPSSSVFYLKMKGELEEAVKKLDFRSMYFLRPNLLTGQRKERRSGEIWGERFLNFFNKLGLLKSQTPISASVVADKMIEASMEQKSGVNIWQSKGLDSRLTV